jgi:hypothetical protein
MLRVPFLKGDSMTEEKTLPEVEKRWTMGRQTEDLREILRNNPRLGDGWVKEQLHRIGKPFLYSDGIADAIRHGEVHREKDYLRLAKNVKPQLFMSQSTGDLKNLLLKNPNFGDEWVKQQLDYLGKPELYHHGIADDIRKGKLLTEQSYYEQPAHKQYEREMAVENPELGEMGAKARGETHYKSMSGLSPEGQALLKAISSGTKPLVEERFKKGAELHPFQQQYNDLLSGLLSEYQNVYGNSLPGSEPMPSYNPYAEGPGLDMLRGLYGGAQGLGSSLYQGAKSGMGALANLYQGYMGNNQTPSYENPLQNLEGLISPQERMENQLRSINTSKPRRF